MQRFTKLIKLQEGRKFFSKEDVLTAIENGNLIKYANGKKNVPSWILTLDEKTSPIFEACIERLLNSISKDANAAADETVLFLVKCSKTSEMMQQICNNSFDTLIVYSKVAKKDSLKQEPLKSEIEQLCSQETYNSSLWHDLEKDLQDEYVKTIKKKSNSQAAAQNLYTTLYEDNTWGLYVPKCFEGDSYLASGIKEFEYDYRTFNKTRWCTAASEDAYEMYTKKENKLYVVKYFENGEFTEAWQFAFCDDSYYDSYHVEAMDKYDKRNFSFVIENAPSELLDKIVIDNNSVLNGLSLLWFKNNGYKVNEETLDEDVTPPSVKSMDEEHYRADKRIKYATDLLMSGLSDFAKSIVNKLHYVSIVSLCKLGPETVENLLKVDRTGNVLIRLTRRDCFPNILNFICSLNLPSSYKIYLFDNQSILKRCKSETLDSIKTPTGTEIIRNLCFFGFKLYVDELDSLMANNKNYSPEEVRQIFNPIKELDRSKIKDIFNDTIITDIRIIPVYAKDYEFVKETLHMSVFTFNSLLSLKKLYAESTLGNISEYDIMTIPISQVFDSIPIDIDFTRSSARHPGLNAVLKQDFRGKEVLKMLSGVNTIIKADNLDDLYTFVTNMLNEGSINILPNDIVLKLIEEENLDGEEVFEVYKFFQEKDENGEEYDLNALYKFLYNRRQLECFYYLKPETQQYSLQNNIDFLRGNYQYDLQRKVIAADRYVELVNAGRVNPKVVNFSMFMERGSNAAVYSTIADKEGLVSKNFDIKKKGDYLALKYIRDNNIPEKFSADVERFISQNGIQAFENIKEYYFENINYIIPDDIDCYGKELCQRFINDLKRLGFKNSDGISIRSYESILETATSQEDIDELIRSRIFSSTYDGDDGNFYDRNSQDKLKTIEAEKVYDAIPNVIKPIDFDTTSRIKVVNTIMVFGKETVYKTLMLYKKAGKSLLTYPIALMCALPGSFDKWDTLTQINSTTLKELSPYLYATKTAEEIMKLYYSNWQMLSKFNCMEYTVQFMNLEFEDIEKYNVVVNLLKQGKIVLWKVWDTIETIEDPKVLDFYMNNIADDNSYGICAKAANKLGLENLQRIVKVATETDFNTVTDITSRAYPYRLGLSIIELNEVLDFIEENTELIKNAKEKLGLNTYKNLTLVRAYLKDLKDKRIPEDTKWEDYLSCMADKIITNDLLDSNRKYINSPMRNFVDKEVFLKHPDITQQDIDEFNALRIKYPTVRIYRIGAYLDNKQEYIRFLDIHETIGLDVDSYYTYRNNKDLYEKYYDYKAKGGKLDVYDFESFGYIEETFRRVYQNTKFREIYSKSHNL